MHVGLIYLDYGSGLKPHLQSLKILQTSNATAAFRGHSLRGRAATCVIALPRLGLGRVQCILQGKGFKIRMYECTVLELRHYNAEFSA